MGAPRTNESGRVRVRVPTFLSRKDVLAEQKKSVFRRTISGKSVAEIQVSQQADSAATWRKLRPVARVNRLAPFVAEC